MAGAQIAKFSRRAPSEGRRVTFGLRPQCDVLSLLAVRAASVSPSRPRAAQKSRLWMVIAAFFSAIVGCVEVPAPLPSTPDAEERPCGPTFTNAIQGPARHPHFQNQEATHVLIADFFGRGDKEGPHRSFEDSAEALVNGEWKRFLEKEGGVAESHTASSGDVAANVGAVEVARLQCFLENHEQARAAATGLGADIVVWGRAGCQTGGEAFAACARVTLVSPEKEPRRGEKLAQAFGLSELELPSLPVTKAAVLAHFTIGMHFYKQGDFNRSARFLEKATSQVAATEKNSEALGLTTGRAYLDLADNETSLRHSRAALWRVAGTGTRMEAVLLNHIGLALLGLGDNDGALGNFRAALVIEEKAFGPEHPNVATDLANIGDVLDANDDDEGALVQFQRAVAIREKTLGKENSGVASLLDSIAGVLLDLNRVEEALSYYRRALAIAQKVFGKDHRSTALAMNNLGCALWKVEQYEESLSYFRAVLTIFEKEDGKEAASVAMTLSNIGGTLHYKGDYDGALPYLERALALQEKAFGKEDPSVAHHRNNVGGTLLAKHDYDGAASQFRMALEALERRFGPDDPKTEISRYYLALSLAEKSGFRLADKKQTASAGVVVRHCPTDCQGLAIGDWITTYSGQNVKNNEHFKKLTAGTKTNQMVLVVVVRDKKKVTLKVRGGALGVVGF